jgi:hypothetical protein
MTIKLIPRTSWNARPQSPGGAISPFSEVGAVIHWEGTGWKWSWNHLTCFSKVREIQNYHMDVKGWSDIAYNFLACPHGFVFEGRGLNKRSAANGDFNVNTLYYAIQCMWGTAAGVAPTNELLTAAREAIDYVRVVGGAGQVLLGHRNTNQTDCPGDEIYAWLKKGAPNPSVAGKVIVDIQDVLQYTLPGAPADPDNTGVRVGEALYRANDAYRATLEGGRVDTRMDGFQKIIDAQQKTISELKIAVAALTPK